MGLRLPVLLVLLIAGFLFHLRLGGLEPALWPDTVFDSQAVAACLEADRCLVRGIATSVPGLRHGTTWLHWRMLAEWAGIGLGGFHLLMHLAGALTFVVTALAAARIAGPWAGVAAALVLARLYLFHDMQPSVVYNNRILPLLGTLAWALCVAAVSHRRAWPLVLAAGVAAVTTEVHVVFGMSVVCLGLSALMLPGRWRMIAIVLGIYGVATLALAPETWVSNVARLWSGIGPSPYTGGEFTWRPLVVEVSVLEGVAILAAGLIAARGEPRRGLATLMAFLAPVLIVYEAAVLAGVTTQTDKYFGAWLGGVAASVACGAFAVAERAWEVLSRRWTGSRRPIPASGRAATVVQCLVAAVVAVWPDTRLWVWKAPGDLPALAMEDARRVAEAARSRGWSLDWMIPRLRSLQGHDLIQWISIAVPWDGAEGTVPESRQTMTVLRVLPSWLPEVMPEGWEAVDRGGDSVLLVLFGESWVDWDRFEVCRVWTSGEADCQETRYIVSKRIKVEENQVLIPRWPWPDPASGASVGGKEAPLVEVRLTVRFPPSGGEQRVFLPDLLRGCAGRVVAAPGAGSEVSPDGRSAVIRAGPGESGGVLTLQWRVGGRECPTFAWPYGIPFFVEAPPDVARPLEEILLRGKRP